MSNYSIQRLFDAFGRKATDGQLGLYVDWMTKAGRHAESIIDYAIQHEERLPTLSKLNGALQSKKTSEKDHYDPTVERCYYCLDTGFIPYLHDPEGASAGVYYTRMYSCKCSKAIAGVPKYFDVWGSLQFEQGDYGEEFMFPHIVSAEKLKLNNQLWEEKTE
jgi:hypothetical protein